MRDLDEEIQTLENRIARERDGVATLLEDCGETVRDAVTSPKALLGVAALGFVIGEALRVGRRSSTAPRPRGTFGTVLASTALALLRASPTSPWLIARHLWSEVRPRPARATSTVRPEKRLSSTGDVSQGR
jgi:hypothetical protein